MNFLRCFARNLGIKIYDRIYLPILPKKCSIDIEDFFNLYRIVEPLYKNFIKME